MGPLSDLPRAPLTTPSALDPAARAVVLVEGRSDQVALETVALRRGRDLHAEGVAIVAMHGATNVARYLHEFGPAGRDVRLAGLCDAGEEEGFRRALASAGHGRVPDRPAMESLGFYVCVADLEDELIRALGVAAVQRVLDEQGELATFRTFQIQPAQRGRAVDAQLRRFMGTKSGRKVRSPRLLIEAMDLAAIPRPLDAVLDRVSTP